jgi:phage tail sheath gpL-like
MPAPTFDNIPSNIMVPLFYAEFKSGGSPYAGNPRLLLIGQKTTAGAATVSQPYGPISSEADAVAQFGLGSMLHMMYRVARRNAPFQPIWALPLADPAGAASTGIISIDTAPAVTGAGVVRIMGRRLAVQVNAADTNAQVAANVITAINAANLPVTALVDGTNAYKVNLTARHVGLAAGATINVTLPTDVANVLTATNTTITPMSGGTGSPVLTTPLANLSSDEYDWVVSPYTDATSLNAVKDFLNDSAGRWSPMQQLYGHHTTVSFGSLSTLATLGNGRNSQHECIVGVQASPVPAWEWAAGIGAIEALHLANPPELSRPLQSLVIDGVMPADVRSQNWSKSDRQALYVAGIAACKVDRAGNVLIDRMVTTYKTNGAGAPDATFRDIETMAQGMYTIRYLRSAVLNKWGRAALADDDPFNVGLATPRKVKLDMIHAYKDLVALGVAENADVFAQNVTVQRNALDANRLDVYFPEDVVNQLRIFASSIVAFLQYNTPSGAVAI